MEKEILIRNFSRYAHLYDHYAQVQEHVASLLLKEMPNLKVCKILELGCGTGNFTRLLTNKFKEAQIKAVDLSVEMVKIARKKLGGEKIEFVIADAQDLKLKESFNLITSNACLHWLSNLEEALKGYQKLLRRGGEIYFSIFGPLTFWELQESLNSISKCSVLSSGNFLGQEGIQQIMRNNFSRVRIKEAIFTQTYADLRELFYKIKYTGVRGRGLDEKIIFTVGLIKRLKEYYLKKFGQIKATYQVFICQGKA